MNQNLSLSVPLEKWNEAQAAELNYWRGRMADDDDWNQWWRGQFGGFIDLPWMMHDSILEVGCGPYANNIRWFMDQVANWKAIGLEDPLITQYIADGKYVGKMSKRSDVTISALPLEALRMGRQYGLVLCINVLDHVCDAKLALSKAIAHVEPNGFFIIGQDLTNDEDIANCKATDPMHPITVDYDFMMRGVATLRPRFLRVLRREHGRNPECHYGTFLFIGQKMPL